MNKEALKNELEAFLQEAQKKQQVFLGRKGGSKTFQIYGFCHDLIIIQYDSYPAHFALVKQVLLDGIDKVKNHGLDIHLTSEYASKIEHSTVQRDETNNRTSVLTKFYFSLHRSFLNKLNLKEGEQAH